MIRSKKELDFYLKADLMMNRGYFKYPIVQRIVNIFSPDYIMQFLRCMRKLDYYSYTKRTLMIRITKIRYDSLGQKLGFSMGFNVFGYGLVIPHYGTIVVGASNLIGNYSVLHTSSCITDNGKKIGDALYLSTGAKLIGKVTFGNNVTVAANSVVIKSCEEGNALLAGIPACKKTERKAWYIEENNAHRLRVEVIENYKTQLEI